LQEDRILLGPGQLAAVGYGRYAAPEFDLGTQNDVQIPRKIAPRTAQFRSGAPNVIEATVDAPERGDLRIILQQRGTDGVIRRSWPGGPPDGTSLGKVLKLRALQDGRDLPLEMGYDRVIWSGLSWAVGEIRHKSFRAGQPIMIRCSSTEKDPVFLEGAVYVVEY
jgi:hypothetical protein